MELSHYINQLLKGSEYKFVLSVAFSIITIIEGFYGTLIWGLLGFLAIDFITGVWKSLNSGERITSKRLRASVTKVGSYMLLLTTLIIAGKVETTFIPLVTMAYYYCMFTEIKSILENLEGMGMKVPGVVLDKLDSFMETFSSSKEEKNKDGDGK